MTLNEIIGYETIAIQCHDTPDADTIACGFALHQFLSMRGKKSTLFYAGEKITKPNLLLMIASWQIAIEHRSALEKPALLITVDCQYGAGNVTRFDCGSFAVFDHHRLEIAGGDHIKIMPQLGSCATLIWDILRSDGFDFAANKRVLTALYYGLFSDTNELSEMRHPLDRDLADAHGVDKALIKRLKYSALTTDELSVVARTLDSSRPIERIGLLRSEPCDANLLGFTSDIARQVDRYDCCVVYAPLENGYKLSIRSTTHETMAHELARFITDRVGSGGGSVEKAGGYITATAIGGVSADEFIGARIGEYQRHFDHIYADRHSIDFAAMSAYRKLAVPVGFARTLDIFPEGTPITVRTLEGDIETIASAEIYLMVGVEGEVYPIARERFEKSYEELNRSYDAHGEYEPNAACKLSGERRKLSPIACLPTSAKVVRAAPLAKDTKLFTHWNNEGYFVGRAGDFLAAQNDDFSDVYIVKKEIFEKTYEAI
ncbi:hypothetical protein FACS189487_11020 [Campylobacterota bacterium]|nr:hypothetical protein FACS189487_11020 [Campylobacterota bacterium]